MHLLCGEDVPERSMEVAAAVPESRQDRISELEAEVARLRTEVARLSEQFDSFRKQFD
jgi:uncharacterized protein YceH (UPF0502 family)